MFVLVYVPSLKNKSFFQKFRECTLSTFHGLTIKIKLQSRTKGCRLFQNSLSKHENAFSNPFSPSLPFQCCFVDLKLSSVTSTLRGEKFFQKWERGWFWRIRNLIDLMVSLVPGMMNRVEAEQDFLFCR